MIMSTLNPRYNLEWESIHDHHSAERNRLQEAKKAVEYGTPEYIELHKQWEEHHHACMDCFKMRHPTIAGYAEWVFSNFDPSEDGIPVQDVDFESFKTLEQVDQTWAKIHKDSEESYYQKRNALPVGQPDGLDIFDTPETFVYRRYFSEDDLYGGPTAMNNFIRAQGHNIDGGIHTLIAVDQRADKFNICILQNDRHVGQSVMNGIERLASVVYKEALAQAESLKTASDSGLRKVFDAIRKTISGPALRPENFNFYIHIPPSGTPGSLGKEIFSRANMKFRDGAYQNADFQHFETIPSRIQNARYESMSEAEPVKPRALPGPSQA
jgi:hypothetical protein